MGSTVSTAKMSKTPTKNSECVFYKYKVPYEIRRLIFIQAAYNFFNEKDPWVMNLQELEYPPPRIDWTKQLEADARPADDKSLPNLERALLHDKVLYFECMQARLSVSVLAIDAIIVKRPAGVSHPAFGKNIPLHLLDHFSHIRYRAWYVNLHSS
jgi:hypothetical protein